jgi:hypothetical protein
MIWPLFVQVDFSAGRSPGKAVIFGFRPGETAAIPSRAARGRRPISGFADRVI